MRYLFSILMLVFVLFGCKKYNELDKLQKTKWKPEMAVPLINSTVTISEILDSKEENDFIEIDDDNLIILVYEDSFSSKKAKDIFKIPDLNGVLNDLNNVFQFDIDQIGDIHNLIVQSGYLNYSIPSSSDDLSVTLTMPYVLDGVEPFSETFIVSINGASGSFDLSNFLFDLTRNGQDINSIQIDYLVTKLINGEDVTSSFPLDFTLSIITFDFLSGHFSTYSFDIQNHDIPINIFKNWKKGEVRLENPQLQLKFKNSFGFPVKGEFGTFEGNGSTTSDLESDVISNGFEMNYPDDGSSNTFENTEVNFNKDNSNIQNFISASPNSIKFAMNFTGNVDVDTSRLDFMTSESEFRANFQLALPMQGKITDALLVDTFSLSVKAEELFVTTESAIFKLNTENHLPVDANIQLYLLNEENEIVDSLLKDNSELLKSGIINSDGNVIESSHLEKLIDYNVLSDDENGITNIKKIVMKVDLDASNQGESVKLYANYFLKVKLGVVAKIEF